MIVRGGRHERHERHRGRPPEEPEGPPPPTYVLGLDLGQSADYTAVVVLERALRVVEEQTRRTLPFYACRFLRRWPLQTRYTKIVADVVTLVATPPLVNPKLAVDQTGVGKAVLDVLTEAQPKAHVRPVLITSGHGVTEEGGAYHVPKKELVSTLQVLLQSRRFKVADLPERKLLEHELLNFKVKITLAANETFESWRERDHDDLVLAVALAAWVGERECVPCEYGAWDREDSPYDRPGPHHAGHRMSWRGGSQ